MSHTLMFMGHSSPMVSRLQLCLALIVAMTELASSMRILFAGIAERLLEMNHEQ